MRVEWTGKFGNGAYKDEPWGIVAMRKRIYAMRSWYQRKLSEELSEKMTGGRVDERMVTAMNPGYT